MSSSNSCSEILVTSPGREHHSVVIEPFLVFVLESSKAVSHHPTVPFLRKETCEIHCVASNQVPVLQSELFPPRACPSEGQSALHQSPIYQCEVPKPVT